MALPILQRRSITAMTYIGGNSGYRPVFRVRVAGNDLVVKAEKTSNASACVSIKWGSKLMKNAASPDAKVSILTQTEIMELAGARAALLPADAEFQTYIQYGQQVVWVKMPFVNGISDSDIYRRGKAGADALFAKMTNDGFWEQLGRVLAVDLFIGNFDRFDGNGVLINKGNVFFKQVGAQFEVVGLDFFAAQFASGEANLAAMDNPIDDTWDYLKVLTEPARRRTYARKVVDELRKHLMKENPAGIYDLYGFTETLDIAIKTGGDRIRGYLLDKRRQYGQAPVLGARRARPAVAAAAAAPPAAAAPAGGWQRRAPGAGAANNNRAVAEGVMPTGISDRMHFLGWI